MKLLKRITIPLILLLALPLVAFAQEVAEVVTSTAVTVEVLLKDAKGVYDAFKMVGALAGITAAINWLVNLTKYGPVRDFIKRKGWKWIRPILALVAGVLAGIVTGIAEGLTGLALVVFVIGGAFSGAGAIAIHEVIAAFKGERSEKVEPPKAPA